MSVTWVVHININLEKTWAALSLQDMLNSLSWWPDMTWYELFLFLCCGFSPGLVCVPYRHTICPPDSAPDQQVSIHTHSAKKHALSHTYRDPCDNNEVMAESLRGRQSAQQAGRKTARWRWLTSELLKSVKVGEMWSWWLLRDVCVWLGSLLHKNRNET